ncbi:hypothetical protein [Nocardia transvalensis]|uniref:hypothetical protein n=1 Tax=Nocardia transvalensis TaxID=37333 RepID=UPI001893025D|nr:hypothetical protein [Nocardia transvalensis]MBF6333420.1 hypothetical protein [Nocardia transvalensis]
MSSEIETLDAEIVLDENEARELTAKIQRAWLDIAERIEATRDLIVQAYLGRAWSLMGYDSWVEYCNAEFALSKMKIPRETRYALVADLRQIGKMSTRSIAAVVGADQHTVIRDLKSAPTDANASVATTEVVDVNGKRHQPTRDRRPKRRPITDDARKVGTEATQLMERIHKLIGDDRFRAGITEQLPGFKYDLKRLRDVIDNTLTVLEGNPNEAE